MFAIQRRQALLQILQAAAALLAVVLTLGRRELKHLTNWNDGEPGTELNFKFYRQATNKIVGICAGAASFPSKCFQH
jgi:hypothetical protein